MSAVVYTNYSSTNPPPHPGPEWTRFVCISDTHSREFSLPPGDVLLHAGDLSSWGYYKQLSKTVDWLTTLPYELKIIIAGNHDLSLDEDWRRVDDDYGGLDPKEVDDSINLVHSDSVCDAGIRYLERDTINIKTKQGHCWRIYGSPAAPKFVSGAFQYLRGEGGLNEWAKIPEDIDILLTHTPPLGTLDLARIGRNVGCEELRNRIQDLRQCRLHVFGHIHEHHGAIIRKREINGEVVNFVSVNAAMMHGDQAVVVDLKSSSVS